jgi:hypothetical protein
MRSLLASCLIGVLLGSCVELGPPIESPATPGHAERFVGTWLVDQPMHALYEATYYTFHADGRLSTGRSQPPDCGIHLERHCVTGSVAKCTKRYSETCQGEPSCVFGDRWRSLAPATLIILGHCSDGVPREIRLEFALDEQGDLNEHSVTLVTVGGETDWSHDNWAWAFRKCQGDDESSC